MFLHCFGSVHYWRVLLEADDSQVFLNHTFQKQSSLSQYKILGPNGTNTLSVPTIKKSRKGWYKDVAVDYSTAWQQEHWKSIANNYRKAPFFQYYDYKLEPLYHVEYQRLIDFNLAAVKVVLKCLKRDEKVVNFDSETGVYFKELETLELPSYPQVYDSKIGFRQDVSVLDLIFNLGPESMDYLTQK